MSAAAASLILLDSAWALQQKPERKLPDPTISVHKHGLRINSRMAKIMGLKEGDLVMLAQDPKFPKDFYLMVHPRGFSLSFSKHGEGRISCSAYFRLICQVLELSETQHKFLRFKVAEKPDTIGNFRCYAVNTVRPLHPDQGEAESPAEGESASPAEGA